MRFALTPPRAPVGSRGSEMTRDSLADEADFEHRFARLHAECPAIAEGIDIMQMRGPATFAFLRSENLLDAVECLVGPEITCSPIQHLRAKPPATAHSPGTGFYNVPWHQDMAVTWEEADASNIVTCWLALDDATYPFSWIG